MGVYVEPLQNHGWVLYGRVTQSCHMTADSDDELHAMAARIGLKRSWHQAPPHHISHYDLTPSRRSAAVAAGAVEITLAQFRDRLRRVCLRCRVRPVATATSRLCSLCADAVVIQKKPPMSCDLCGKVAELRPYGPKGEYVCFECGMKDEAAAKRAFQARLEGKG